MRSFVCLLILPLGVLVTTAIASQGEYRAEASLSGYVSYSMFPPPGYYRKGLGDIPHSGSQYGALHGWARFDLGEVPREATVLGATVLLYQYSSSGQSQTRAVLVKDVMAPAETLYGYLSGMLLSDPVTCQDGWYGMPFYACGVVAVESCLAQGYLDVGITGAGSLYSGGSAYGYTRPSDLRANLALTFRLPAPFVDIAAANVRLTSFPCRVSESETIRFSVLNKGDCTADTFTSYLSVNGVTIDSVRHDSITPGESLNIPLLFRAPAAEQEASIRCYVRSSSDLFHNNDTARLDCWVLPAYTTAAVDFEPDHFPSFPPPGWLVVNGGGNYWRLNATIDLYAHTGRYHALCTYGEGTPDDWLITSGLDPSATTADTVGLFLCGHSTNYDSVQVWALYAQDPEARLGLLLDTLLAPVAWREFRLSLDQFEGQLTYIGIRRFWAGMPGIYADDIWFSCPVEGAVSEQRRLRPKSAAFLLTPNLTRGSRVQLSWALASPAEVRADVVDAVGRCRLSTTATPTRTEGSTALRLDGLPAGAYFVHVVSGAHAQTMKFVLEH